MVASLCEAHSKIGSWQVNLRDTQPTDGFLLEKGIANLV